MAVKTITIDLEAYELLARQKKPGQSFSQVIKERFGGAVTGAELLRRIASTRMSSEALDAVDRVLARRRDDHARAARL
jgi:predicted CopG family antitoxin